MHWPKSPSWNGTQIVQKKETSLHRTFTKASWSWGTSNVPIIYLRDGPIKVAPSRKEKNKVLWSLLYSLSCSNLSKANLHGFLLFLCAHPFVVRTTLTFTYWVQSEPNCYGTTWGVDGWMNGGGMDQSYYQLSWDSSTIESGKSSNPLVTDLGFVHCNWFISRFHPLKLILEFIHPKIHPFAPEMLSNEVIKFHGPDMLIISGRYQGFFFEVLTLKKNLAKFSKNN